MNMRIQLSGAASVYSMYALFCSIILQTQGVVTVFEDVNFQGASRTLLPFKACLDLTYSWNNRISSVDTSDGCITLCELPRCGGRCEKVYPGTLDHHDLRSLNFNDMVSSYRNCEGPNDNNIPN